MENSKKKQKIRYPVFSQLLSSRSFLLICVLCPVLIITLNILDIFTWTCPTYSCTGLYCPGCGMTRAGMALVQGDFSSAFSHHPFSLLFAAAWIFFLLLLFFPNAKRQAISAKFARFEEKFPIIPLLFILFVFFGLIRLFFQIFD